MLAKTFGSIALVLAVVFFGGREVLLVMARLQIDDEVEKIRSGAKVNNAYAVLCTQTFTIAEQAYALSAVQIRFTNDREYHVEVVCVNRESDPIVLRSGSLPPFVRKNAGSSGAIFVYNQPINTFVELSVYGRSTRLLYRDAGVAARTQYPVAVCAGWGHQCCDPITMVPGGNPTAGQVLDCPGGCFSACKQRPLILSFRSEPQVKPETRAVRVKNGQAMVTFSVIAANPGNAKGVSRVELDYGDGVRDTFTKEQISLSHTYTCATFSCAYSAKVVAYDADGLSSPEVRTSSMTVIVE